MTPKTLTQERIQKFTGIVADWLQGSPSVILKVTIDEDILDGEISKLVMDLVEASKSRSEIQAEYKLTPKDIQEVNKTVDHIIANKAPETYWQGQELIPPHWHRGLTKLVLAISEIL